MKPVTTGQSLMPLEDWSSIPIFAKKYPKDDPEKVILAHYNRLQIYKKLGNKDRDQERMGCHFRKV